ncbi:Geranylgeranyl reductase flavoprotein [Methanonatronarchaeum thermophilum]|uniref:Geranylgeranyl reductase flavoprotein n=1 Tax=Methanonatronarchaeum thermophilum TaxID=1927129 RepID=A0A1Y3GIJ5_9EURY|nr:NAD(P)/FAD-dependent oxidoreductase [Methanonatronarchaeum thermophilum]OUJ19216.1 Geranylgeranyl reductase flavoprotein [Methanonatronarchaeum thermophilum]
MILVVRDVSIVGGGLSGLLTARYLDRVPGVDVRVFERRSRERYRVDCGGGFIDLRGVLGLVSDEVRSFVRCEVGSSVWRFKGDFGVRKVSVEHDDFFWIIDRVGWQEKVIDDLCDVDLVFGEEVDVESLDSDLVVDAGGARYRLGSAVYGVYKGDFSKLSNRVIFDYRQSLDGYYWVFPMEDGFANIGCGEFGGDVGEGVLDSYVGELPFEVGFKVKHGGGYFDYTYFLKDVRGRRNRLIQKKDGGWLARVGDAAGVMDPLTGEGIGGAVSTAYCLSKAVKKDSLDKYPVWVEKQNNHTVRKKMAVLRKKDYQRFVRRMGVFDGVRSSDCYSVPKFLIKHPIRSIKFLKS